MRVRPGHGALEPTRTRRPSPPGLFAQGEDGSAEEPGRWTVPAVRCLRQRGCVRTLIRPGPPDERRPAVPGANRQTDPGPAPEPCPRHQVGTAKGPKGPHLLGLPTDGSPPRPQPPDILDP